MGLDQISFLAADVSTDAFNRDEPWDDERRDDIAIAAEQLPALRTVLETIITDYAADFASSYIAESPQKLRRLVDYYAAMQGRGPFPPVRCNAPWVSAVVEADGTVRPCYFQRPMGNIRETPLTTLLNNPEELVFRRSLDMDTDPICRQCVCTLNLRPTVRIP